MEPVALWLLSEVAVAEAYAALRKLVLDKNGYKRLQAAVRDATGKRLSMRYKRWLREETTWDCLVARTQEAYDRLVDSLTIAESSGLFRRHPPDRHRAVELVNATIAHFVQTLDPSLAVAVVDIRAEHRHAEVMERFDARSTYEDRLHAVPPGARCILVEDQDDRAAADKLVYAVTSGDPASVIVGLVNEPPPWLTDAPAQIVEAVAEIAQSHALTEQAGVMFEKAADLGRDRHRNYARAAFLLGVNGDTDRCNALLQRARASGTGPWADVIEAGLAQEWERIPTLMSRDVALVDPFTANIYVAALLGTTNNDDCISFLREAVERHPEYSGLLLRLGGLLLERSTKPVTTSRSQDQRSALESAVRARDLRRCWQGPSAEAVRLACQAALLADDYERVLEVGTVAPDGAALPSEAAEPEVQFLVAQAAIALGRVEQANSVAEVATGFRQALIKAEVLAASDRELHDVTAQYESAWELAETEEEKVDLWLSASACGVVPVPGSNELNGRTDETAVLIAAQSDVSRGHFEAAIGRLRPLRAQEAARRVLVGAYLKAGRVDDAVTELVDAARRFDKPAHLVRAVQVLVGQDRVDDAAPLAERVLPLIADARAPLRNFMYEVGVAAAHNRRAWQVMEERARAWINDMGADPSRRWLLVLALYNQAVPDAAWRVLREGGDLQPQTALEARLWIVLHEKYEPGPASLSKMLALCDRYPDDADVRAAAVNAFILMGNDKGDVDPDEIARWQTLIRQRAESPGENDFFMSVSVPDDDPSQMIEAIRPFLEPEALRIKEMREKVRQGWPYGMLAAVAGRTYTATLTQRAMGYLAPFTMNRAIQEEEQRVAAEALDGKVLVDLSTLAVGWLIADLWPQLIAAFSSPELTSAARRDVGATANTRLVSSETLGWDLASGRPVLQETPQEQIDRLRAHTDWIETRASNLSIREWPVTGSQTRLRDQDDGFAPWLAGVELAAAEGTALWADDVGLRQLARDEGVRVFGTAALMNALVSSGALSPAKRATALVGLRDEFCVDLPLDPGWVESRASRDGWKPGVAQFSFSRAASWADLQKAFELWRAVVSNAGAASPDLVGPWVHAATSGVCDAVERTAAHNLIAGLLVTAAGAVNAQATEFAACVAAAGAVCDDRQLPAPTELALTMMLDKLAEGIGLDNAATAVARLGSQLTGEDRAALLRVLFGEGD